jgi:hypothetical protein
MSSNKQIDFISLSIFIAVFLVVGFLGFNTKNVFAQDQDNYEVPQYDNPVDVDDFDNNQPQNPDPGFMEEQEPGEYNQSDDTTELN